MCSKIYPRIFQKRPNTLKDITYKLICTQLVVRKFNLFEEKILRSEENMKLVQSDPVTLGSFREH